LSPTEKALRLCSLIKHRGIAPSGIQ